MKIQTATLETCNTARDTVVVIDVCRAFTSAPFAFAAGASEIILVSTVEEAFTLREQIPDALIMGEVGGLPPAGFDFGNSPNEFSGANLRNRRMIQRTSAGTQGIVRSAQAEHLLASSFVCAGATARYISQLAPESVTLVITGERPGRRAFEDVACADYLSALLAGQRPDVRPFLARARKWLHKHAGTEVDPARRQQMADDLERCLEVDRFGFVMRVEHREGLLVMEAVKA
jgi:2-phosphosulfolactate phosphatase